MIQKTAFDKTGLAFQKRTGLIVALTALTAISAAVEIAAQYFGPRTIVYIFKPLTMVFIIVIAMMTGARDRSSYRRLVVAGLCCSLAGDVFLMLPSDQFVSGLLSFLIAHLFYIAAFRKPSGLLSVWFGLACVAYGSIMLWFLFPYLGDMKLPVSIYLVVILLMAWLALNRWMANRHPRAVLAALGAILFVASDSMIAINRFYGQFRLADLLILATYFVAQWLIALSVA